MTIDEQAFWQAISDRPWDDLPKLMFADWLDEQGDELAPTIRAAIKENLRPVVRPDGSALWVTTTGDPLVWRAIPRGRTRSPRTRPRTQSSWLAPCYYHALTGSRSVLRFIESGTVWLYQSVAEAYRDLHVATAKLVKGFIDPKTGISRFSGMTQSRWRDESLRAIAIALADLKSPSWEEKAKALRAAYPFGLRRGWPYKMWLQEQRRALGPKPGSVSVMALGSCGWCHGKGCVACAGKRFAESEEAS